MKIEYKFNPEKFGFESAEKFPEIKENLAKNSFVKVTAIGDKKVMGRSVYWYHVCHSAFDDRWNISSDAYDSSCPNEIPKLRTDYSGLISNDDFAEMLLKHLLGTGMQASVEEEGAERLKENINNERFN